MYLLLLIPAFLITYWMLAYGFQYFFHEYKKPEFRLTHILTIIITFFVVVSIVSLIPHDELANRIQHALGGGFLMVMIAYFSLLASRVRITRFQFFILSSLIATGFGVANELAESILQNFASLIFAPNIDDTWLDLWANSIGALIGAGILTACISHHES